MRLNLKPIIKLGQLLKVINLIVVHPAIIGKLKLIILNKVLALIKGIIKIGYLVERHLFNTNQT